MESESSAMMPHALLFLDERTRLDAGHGGHRLFQRLRRRHALPRPFAMKQTAHPALLTRRREQATCQVTESTFLIAVGPGHVRHIVVMEQTWVVAGGHRMDRITKGLVL